MLITPHESPKPTASAAEAWGGTDPLAEALHHLRMSGVFYTRSELTSPWGIDLPAMPDCVMFHMVTAGECVLLAEGREPVALRPGTFSLVPHGEGHVLASHEQAEITDLFDTTRHHISDRYELLVHGGGGEPCRMICGAVKMDHPAARRLVALLPHRIVTDVWQATESDSLQHTLRLMASEVEHPRPGGEAVITRLADVLVIQAIRSWMAHDPAAKTGWLAAMQDPQIGQALLHVHRDPERAWSVQMLAETVAMSRSAFSARFAQLVGETPMQYVRSWKMHVAAGHLADDGVTVAELAYRFGYDSEAAFSRAFKKVMGTSPGAARTRDDPTASA